MRRVKVQRVKWEPVDKIVCGLLAVTTLYLWIHIAVALWRRW